MRIALLSSSGVDLLRAPLLEELQTRGFEATIWTAGFGQYQQSILDPGSGLDEFCPDAIILYLDAADRFRALAEDPFAFTPKGRRRLAEDALTELQRLKDVLQQRLPGTQLLINTVFLPPRNTLLGLEYNTEHSMVDVTQIYNNGLRELASASCRVVDVAALMSFVGFAKWHDARLWCLARSRLSSTAARSLARRYAAVLASEHGGMRKCLVLDLDNVLWGGVVGEEGLRGIILGEEGTGLAFAEFQQELRLLQRKGFLLAVCSKNNPEDALAVIRDHPSMRLRESDFAALRIGWENKGTNIRALAQQLNLGLDALAFIDDSPVERTWVRRTLPEVLVPEWPTDPSDFVSALLELEMEAFEKVELTTDDRRRTAQYAEETLRRDAASAAGSLEEFYCSLRMVVSIGIVDPATLPRVAQLTQRTNQFNLTTQRYTEAEIEALTANPDARVFWIALKDCFGDSGIVGVLIVRRQENTTWNIDTFLLSCRVMGRTVERAFLGHVASMLHRLGARHLIGTYIPTSKNAPVATLYAELGFRSHGSDAQKWIMDLATQMIEVPAWFEVSPSEESHDVT